MNSLGKKHQEYLQAKKNYKNAGFFNSPQMKNAYYKKELAKLDFKDAKVSEKMNGHKKSRYEQKLEKKYLDAGWNKKDAEIAAYRKNLFDKSLGIVGGLSAAAIVGYSGYKVHNFMSGMTIKKGSVLQRMETDKSLNPNELPDDRFYASFGKHDNEKYFIAYGDQICKQFGGTVFKKNISVNNDLKIASVRTGLNAYRSVHPGATQKDYLNFVLSGAKDKAVRDNLVKRGYSGIKDLNDMLPRSTFAGDTYSKNPVIIFGNKKVSVSSVKKIGEDFFDSKEYNDRFKKLYAKEIIKDKIIPQVQLNSIYADIGIAGHYIRENSLNKQYTQYLKDHPQSKMTRNQFRATLKTDKNFR